jgi:hypothetical protein
VFSMTSRLNRTSPALGKSASVPVPAVKLSAQAALSFLKDSKGAVCWALADMASVLKIGKQQAEQVVAMLAAQGYVSEQSKGSWLTTAAGESVSGAKTPRYAHERVEQALKALKERIRTTNQDKKTPFRITEAVAFGDFLLNDRAKAQAADVGIRLATSGRASETRSAAEAKAEQEFLKQLRGKVQLLNVRRYADWMSQRSHLRLM